jgi:hypothetical protein
VGPSENDLARGDGEDQYDDEDDEEQEEQDLGDRRRPARKAGEAEGTRDDRDQEENQRPFQHIAPVLRRARLRAANAPNGRMLQELPSSAKGETAIPPDKLAG